MNTVVEKTQEIQRGILVECIAEVRNGGNYQFSPVNKVMTDISGLSENARIFAHNSWAAENWHPSGEPQDFYLPAPQVGEIWEVNIMIKNSELGVAMPTKMVSAG